MALILTVLSPTINLRRGPNDGASIIRQAKVGEQFDVVQVLDTGSVEQWARITLPDQKQEMAYACVRLPSGKQLSNVSNVRDNPGDSGDEYKRGKREAVEKLMRHLQQELDTL